MGHLAFYLTAIAACLLWSATFTAAAARTERCWLRRLLATLAAVVPLAALLPWVLVTGMLAFQVRLSTNWFAPTLTTFLSALIGGLWIVRAGLSPSAFSSPAVAASWPIGGLAALFLLAKAVAFGIVLILDNAVAAQAPYLRLEAAHLMQANLPPAVADSQNAAPLYQQAFAILDADPAIQGENSPLASATTIDTASPAVSELLARHAATLDLIRRGADRDTCRFQRDWMRPSVDLRLPELQSLRTAARLLALEARREAAAGNAAAALRDAVRIHRIGRHAASEPILISNLVGWATDALALDTLAHVLPTLRKTDIAALDANEIRDLCTTAPTLAGSFYGEEAFGLTLFADILDGKYGLSDLNKFGSGDTPAAPSFPRLDQPLAVLFNSFFLPADLAGYRAIMRQYQTVAANTASYEDAKKKLDSIEAGLSNQKPGMISSLMVPAIGAVFRAQTQNVARHRAATALVAATKQRLETGSLPTTFADLAEKVIPPGALDPFAADKPLLMKRAGDSLVVYSVGPDGEDDGGPVAPGTEKADGNDDIGLRLAL